MLADAFNFVRERQKQKFYFVVLMVFAVIYYRLQYSEVNIMCFLPRNIGSFTTLSDTREFVVSSKPNGRVRASRTTDNFAKFSSDSFLNRFKLASVFSYF